MSLFPVFRVNPRSIVAGMLAELISDRLGKHFWGVLGQADYHTLAISQIVGDPADKRLGTGQAPPETKHGKSSVERG